MKNYSLLLNFIIILFYFLLFINSKNRQYPNIDYKKEMVDFISRIKNCPDGGIQYVIPQNGVELLTHSDAGNAPLNQTYIQLIDGQAVEDLYYGYYRINQASPSAHTQYISQFLQNLKKHSDKQVFVIDYCRAKPKIKMCYEYYEQAGFTGLVSTTKTLDRIPAYDKSWLKLDQKRTIQSMDDIKNFLYLINPGSYSTKADFLKAVSDTDFDLIIMDAFFDIDKFSKQEIEAIKKKNKGADRIVLSYFSIGEAEDYRFYWDTSWKDNNPEWLDKENPNWKGNFKVRYWMHEWQKIICGWDGSSYSGWENSYLKIVQDAGFDGVYLDIVDAFEYFEQKKKEQK